MRHDRSHPILSFAHSQASKWLEFQDRIPSGLRAFCGTQQFAFRGCCPIPKSHCRMRKEPSPGPVLRRSGRGCSSTVLRTNRSNPLICYSVTRTCIERPCLGLSTARVGWSGTEGVPVAWVCSWRPKVSDGFAQTAHQAGPNKHQGVPHGVALCTPPMCPPRQMCKPGSKPRAAPNLLG